MQNKNRYKIEGVENWWWKQPWPDNVQRPPSPPATNIDWDTLVSVLAEHGVIIAKKIRYYNEGENGKRMLDRKELFLLWKAVEKKRKSN